jgi:hypothetical protein
LFRRSPGILAALAAVGLTAIVATLYREVARTYYFNDDFQWIQGARTFAVANVFHIERYNHFYRPIIELYFFAGRRLFGCDAFSFHAASVTVHLVNTALLYGFARALTKSAAFAGATALLFAVQPGYVQAVVWVAAITDLLPAAWYLLALWTYLLFLEGRGRRFYGIALAAFAACLLTHESSATLLATMAAMEWLLVAAPGGQSRAAVIAAMVRRFVPFAVLLAAYLALEYVVNSRSYLITEGHYQLGWHAIPHGLDYLLTLAMGAHTVLFRVLAAVGAVVLLIAGPPRVRFFVFWILVTVLPATFFTWENVSRYLYLPAAGFAMLLTEGIQAMQRIVATWLSPRSGHIVTAVVTMALAASFARSASMGPKEFREWTRPYRRFVSAVQRANPAPAAGSVVYIDRENAEGIPPLYLDPAAEVASCGTDVHVVLR